MADRVSFKLEGIDVLEQKLGRLMAARTLQAAAQSAGETIVDDAGQYPPESAANNPPAPYYQRGMGTVTSSGSIRRTSENLSKRWRTDAKATGVDIENTASYAQFVHGRRQARFHGRRGWRKLKPTARRLMPQIQRAIVRQWARIVDLD